MKGREMREGGERGEEMVNNPRSAAIFLMVLLALDTILDFQSIARYDKMWRGWALAGRTVIATGYAAMFAAYVATGGAFPEGYVYWGLGTEYSGPLVYVLLWVLGYVLSPSSTGLARRFGVSFFFFFVSFLWLGDLRLTVRV